jgi:hypothetical protein
MPETLTEIHQQEEQRRQRAYRYERTLAEQENAASRIEGRQKESDTYAKQVTLITKLLHDAEQMDGRIDVTCGVDFNRVQGSARDIVLDILTAAKADQKRRLDDALQKLVQARADLQRAEQALAELS